MRIKTDSNLLGYLRLAFIIFFGLATLTATGGRDANNSNNKNGNSDDPCDYNLDIVCENSISPTTGEPCVKVCFKNSGFPSDFIMLNNKFIFSAYEGCANTEQHKLFELDSLGNIKEIFEIGSITEEIVLNNVLYFIQHGYLCKYDGLNPAEKIFPASSNSIFTIKTLMQYNNVIYFNYYNEQSGSFSLYSYDGVNPPSPVDDIIASGEHIIYHGKLYFWAYIGNDSNTELWYLADNDSKPILTADINPTGSSMLAPAIIIFQDKMYFSATDGVNGGQLWMMDDEHSPVMVTDLPAIEYQWGTGDSWIRPAAVFMERLLCEVTQKVGEIGYYKRLYAYDGNNLEQMPVEASYDSHMWLYYGQEINSHVIFNDHFYFLAEDTSLGDSIFNFLWEYDGVNAPTKINTEDYIADIYPDNGRLLLQGNNKILSYDGEGDPDVFVDLGGMGLAISEYDPVALFNNSYFVAGDSENYGSELWKIDAIGEASLIRDFYPGTTCECDCMD